MIQHQLSQQLDSVARRNRRYRLLRWLSIGWLGAAAAGGGLLLLQLLTGAAVPWAFPVLAVLAALVGLGIVAANHPRPADRREAARAVEAAYPDLKQRLLAAVEQQPSLHTGRLNFLQHQVVSEAVAHGFTHDWLESVSARRLRRASWLHGLCAGLLAAVAGALWAFEPPPTEATGPSGRIAAAGSRSAAGEYGLTVEPGDASIERGTSLLVLARFSGALPGDVRLFARSVPGDEAAGESQTESPSESRQIELTKSLDDPVFGGRLSQIRNDLTYHVEFDGHTSAAYRVTVFDYPALETADATIHFPDYTGLEETRIEDARQISVVEGSTVTLDCRMNKPVAEARLVADDKTEIVLKPTEAEHVYRAALKPAAKTHYRLYLTDEQGRANKDRPEFTINVVPNRRPELKLAFPGRDVRVSPLEELQLEARAWDDFGLTQYGLVYHLAGQEPHTEVLGESAPGKRDRPMDYVLSLENLQAEPDQLLSYYFFADDVGPDGRTRRTFSDMYFAEVRPFEEIFREGQQQSQESRSQQQQQQQGEGGGQAQQAERLAELQKQIIGATWKLIRRETYSRPTDEFVPDAVLLKESQDDALSQARELAEKITDPQSQSHVEAVLKHMTEAGGHLAEAAENEQTEPLTPALAAEQSAYQALLRLRAREHEVVRSQESGGGGGGGGGRSQEQLQQLALSNREDRYQTQNQASNREQNAAANREQLQVLNRLRELARRQTDVNQRLKELENALREAQTEEEQEEIRRQLKRLREEQQELLRDVDQLRNRMDQPENQSQMAESRRQLDQTRERVQQASEALQEGRTSQALSAGTRAERELEQLRDEFRRKTAGQFDDAMKDLREQARDLAQRQEDLGRRLNALDGEQRRTLRSGRERDDIEDGLRGQKEQVGDVLEQTRQIIQEAETAEPLLSKQLYEVVRKARERQPEDALEITSQLLRRGLLPEAREAESAAREGIDELRRGVERAAEGVLGNEVDALKRATRELRELTEALENELAQADPDGAGRRTGQRNERAGEDREQSENRRGQREAGRDGDAAESERGRGSEGRDADGRDPQGRSDDERRPGAAGSRTREEDDADESRSGRSGSQRPQADESQRGGRRDGEQRDGEQRDGERRDGRGEEQRDGSEGAGQRDNSEGRAGAGGGRSSQPRSEDGEPSDERQRGTGASGRQPGERPEQDSDQQPASPGSRDASDQGQASGEASGQQDSEGGQPGGQQAGGQPGGQQPGRRGDARERGGMRDGGEGALSSFLTQAGADRTGGGGNRGPLTGEDFQDWSDRLREVEEMVEDARLRAEVADIRDRARSMRAEFIRHSKEPNWTLVRTSLFEPLVELQTRLAEEIARKESHDALVPLDRDPIPDRYQELVRRYYERLGGVRD